MVKWRKTYNRFYRPLLMISVHLLLLYLTNSFFILHGKWNRIGIIKVLLKSKSSFIINLNINLFSGYQAHLRVGLGSIQWSSTWSSQEQLDAQIGFQNHDWNLTWKLNPICWRKVRKSSINSRFLRCHWTSELVRRCQGIISRENLSVWYIVNKIL